MPSHKAIMLRSCRHQIYATLSALAICAWSGSIHAALPTELPKIVQAAPLPFQGNFAYTIEYSNDGSQGPIILRAYGVTKSGEIVSQSPSTAKLAQGSALHAQMPLLADPIQLSFVDHAMLCLIRPDTTLVSPCFSAPAPPLPIPMSQMAEGTKKFFEKQGWGIEDTEQLAVFERSYLIYLKFEDFDAIEREFETESAADQKTSDGRSFGYAYLYALRTFNGEDQEAAKGVFARWKIVQPDGFARRIADADARLWRAEKLRTERAEPADPDLVKALQRQTSSAATILDQMSSQQKATAIWSAEKLDQLRLSGAPRRDFEQAQDRALNAHPGSLAVIESAVQYYTRRDDIDWASVERLLQRASKQSTPTDAELYASGYLIADGAVAGRSDVLSDSAVQWPLMRAGLELLVQEHPNSENLNIWASYACQAHDKPEFLKATARLGPSAMLPFLWAQGHSPESCMAQLKTSS